MAYLRLNVWTSVLLGILMIQGCRKNDGNSTPQTSGEPVRVVSWGGQFEADMLTTWVQPAADHAGVAISSESWDGDSGALAARIRKGITGWDLVHVEAQFVNTDADSLFERVDGFDWAALAPDFPHLSHAVPVLEYGYVLAYRSDRVPQTLTNWADFWDIDRIPGKRGLRDFPIGNIEIALLSLNRDPETVLYDQKLTPTQVEDQINDAFAQLDKLRPAVVWWKSGDQLERGIVSGDTPLVAAWSGRVVSAERKLRDSSGGKAGIVNLVDTNVPVSTDWWVIPKGSTHRKAALSLLAAMYSNDSVPLARNFAVKQGYAMPLIGSNDVDDEFAKKVLVAGSGRNPKKVHINEDFWAKHFEGLKTRWLGWRARQ